ncbi:MAG: SDR family NAD(P)-dependent oxidoreductase, partial [Polyangiaceae bacterium]|nr:SDR family NAD(P)-dependent oxidoreductase [Polyangiaceae bacterium]
MNFRPKPLAEQVIVITGASSGIGLTTARLAASRGAKVVAAARSPEMEAIASKLCEETGGEIVPVLADVAREVDVRRIASVAVEHFGGIDTWVNNAGVALVGPMMETPVLEMRDLFETNFWGLVHGSRIAVEEMSSAGGTLINIGSVLSDRAIPLQGVYSAAKHAVKGFTDSLRMELEHDGIPVNVTLVKPATVDTPYFAHAKNHLPEGFPAS